MSGILLATDGREHTAGAAKRAIDVARERGSERRVRCVVDRRVRDESASATPNS